MGTVYPSVCQEGGRSQKEAAATARDQSATDHPPEQTSLPLLQSRPASFASLPELRSHKKQIWFHILPPSVSSSSYSILDRNQQRDVQALQLDPLGGRPCLPAKRAQLYSVHSPEPRDDLPLPPSASRGISLFYPLQPAAKESSPSSKCFPASAPPGGTWSPPSCT